MKCKNCGKEIDDDSLFCEFCGAKIIVEDKSKKKLPSISKKLWLIIVSVITIPIVLLLLFYFVIDNPKCHKYNLDVRGDYASFEDGYTYFYIRQYPKNLNKIPYHLKYDQSYLSIEHGGITTYINDFSITQNTYYPDNTTEWALRIPKDEGFRLIPGEKYTLHLYGAHDGVVFYRWDDFIFNIKLPLSTGSNNDHEYVDLGLSVKWATCNVGATEPTEYGDYYSWGETYTKTNFDVSNYKFWIKGRFISDLEYSKYNTEINHGKIDNKTVLSLEDDVAHILWGGDWRMPTIQELEELLDNCIWEIIKLSDDKTVYKFSSKKIGFTHCSILLPAAGCYLMPTEIINQGYHCYYWSSTLTGDNPNIPYVLEDYYIKEYFVRNMGLSIRPVCP